ncbi:uncharacterized protein Tco025E_06021 [Trypanosoma conorhini]|uniref:Uncharacterized protein n=1 Tax=Trypanosoma conorhini TaxID=83891 RepID=A0A422P9B3_9TRYP|nr:uncharacterized protein Tco025E_06021 [Trypanosoma conorhini]RNF14288.1 hypothetical protein Tco025E_06021 [Trypanosoma conorhini]
MLPEKKVSFFHKSPSTRERGPSIVIPNIPKVVDERARMKLLCDYEKYEPELFKHHLGTPETTQTIGLKLAPVEFDRRLPSPSEPTVAEREYEAHKRLRKHNKQLSFSVSPYRQSAKGGAADVQLAAPATGEAARASPTRPSTAVPLPEHVLPQTATRTRSMRSIGPSSAPTPPPLSPVAKAPETAGKKMTPAAPQKQLSPSRPPQQVSQEKPPKFRTEIRKETIKPMVPKKPLHPAPPRKGADVSGIPVGLPQSKPGNVLTAEHCAQLLRVLLCTPPEYSESFKLDLQNIDLRWMHGSRYPGSFVTLHTWHPPEGDAKVTSLNSPRSVIVMLQNGIVVNDLVPHTTIHDDALLPPDPEMRQLVKRMRMERQRRYREELLASLQERYVELCRGVNLAEVIKAFHENKKQETVVELPTSLKKEQERQQRALLMERTRIEKQINLAKDVHERQLIAEDRQRRVEEEARARIEAKKAEERLAHERAAERLALQRQKIAELEAFYKKGLQERQARAEEKQARRAEAQQRQIEHRREEQERLAGERQLRFQRVAEQQEQQKLMIQQKHEAKEEKLRRLREEQERQQEKLRAKTLERAVKSVELREMARKRAAMHEEKVRQAAEEQQRKMEERIARFQQSSKAARAERALQEEQKRTRMKEAFAAAVDRVNTFKEEVIEKQVKHQKLFDELQRRRDEEILTRQEREREDMEAKSFAVLRNKRMTEFGKLETVLQLLSKREAALSLERERALLRQETRKAREAMLVERQALKEMVLQTELAL